MKLVVLKVFGDLAHFRKFYTTSSPLTFPFPPPPTIRGMVGAIMGFRKDEYLEKTKDLWIGVKINNTVKKIRLGLNLIYTKSNSNSFDPTLILSRKFGQKGKKQVRTQVKAEFLRNPSYTLYVYSPQDRFTKELYNLLKEHKTNYTLSLGLSELIADFEIVGMLEAEKIEQTEQIDSVVPITAVKEINLEMPQKIGKERIPVHMDSNRKVLKYEDVIFSVEGKSIFGNIQNSYRLENGEVVWLWEPQAT